MTIAPAETTDIDKKTLIINVDAHVAETEER
jgi:hypothetical protein